MKPKNSVRVALITTTFPAPGNRSLGVFVAKLVQALNRYAEITVVAPSYKGQKKYFIQDVPVYPFRYAPAPLEILAQSEGGIPVALKRNRSLYLVVPCLLLSLLYSSWRIGRRCDLIHANWAICGAVGGIVAQLMHKPMLTTLRGDDVTRAKVSRIHRMLLHLTLRFSDKVVAVSDAIAQHLVQAYPWANEKVVAIYNGVDDAFTKNGAKRKVEGKEPLQVLTVANLIERKGVEQILHAIALIGNHARLQFTIVGEGPEKENLKHLARQLGVEGRVEFTGSHPHEKIVSIMQKADVFILASHSEGRANVLLEAMASGLAVIASDIDGSRELVRDQETGLLFPVGDVRKLADNMERCFKEAIRARLGEAAHQYILDSGLTWENTAKEYIGQYHMAMGK